MTHTSTSHGSAPPTGPPVAGVVIPIRAFALGKARLAELLSAGARADLIRRWADQVADAAGALGDPRGLVRSRRPGVGRGRALPMIDDPGSLDAAADAGRAWGAERGWSRVVVAHADLPDARTFAGVVRDGRRAIVTIVPCHRDDGTPVLSLPVDLNFHFAYGPGSFRRHAAEARRVGAAVRVVRDPSLAFDVDLPGDLALLRTTTRL